MRPLLHTAIMCWQGSPSTRGTPQLHVPKNEPLVSFPGIRVVYLLDEVNVISAVYENPENKCCAQEQHSSNELCDVYENTENKCCAQKHNSPLNAVFE